MEGDFKDASIILDKDCRDDYFNQTFFKYQEELNQTDNVELNKEIPLEAKKYKVVPSDCLKITVLTNNDFDEFLKNNNIKNKNLENKKDNSCILVLPDYNTSNAKSIMKEDKILQLGRIEYTKKGLQFNKYQFKIEKLLTPRNTSNGIIQLIICEDVAKNNPLIIGYDTIKIDVDKNCPITFQREIHSKIALLRASIQGGRIDSSLEINETSHLLKNYSTIISKMALVFSIISIFNYIVLNSYIDWMKNRYTYGILRSMGMSYFELQDKLFVKYITSIIIASIVSTLIASNLFPNGELKFWHIILSTLIVSFITLMCRCYLHIVGRKESISHMLISKE